MNLPNALTLLRVLLIPVFILFLSKSDPLDLPFTTRALVAAGIFAVASFTDWLDGYIARSTGQVTRLGKLLDPIADKILTSTAFILLVAHNQIAAWMAVVFIGREFAVTGLRAIASADGHVIAANDGGKLKMVFQIFAITALLLDMGYKNPVLRLNDVGTIAIWVAMLLAVISGLQYFIKYWGRLNFSEKT